MWRWCERMVWEMVVAVVVMSRSITFVINGQLNVIRGQSIIQRPSFNDPHERIAKFMNLKSEFKNSITSSNGGLLKLESGGEELE